jgi:hypothetical protein
MVLAAGSSGQLPDGRTVKVVDALQRSDGRCEFLGVAGFAAEEAETAATAAPLLHSAERIEAQPLPMPYALPR